MPRNTRTRAVNQRTQATHSPVLTVKHRVHLVHRQSHCPTPKKSLFRVSELHLLFQQLALRSNNTLSEASSKGRWSLIGCTSGRGRGAHHLSQSVDFRWTQNIFLSNPIDGPGARVGRATCSWRGCGRGPGDESRKPTPAPRGRPDTDTVPRE